MDIESSHTDNKENVEEVADDNSAPPDRGDTPPTTENAPTSTPVTDAPEKAPESLHSQTAVSNEATPADQEGSTEIQNGKRGM